MLTQSSIFALLSAASSVAADVYTVPSQPNANGEPFDGFVSYSIEFSSFPDFAGKDIASSQSHQSEPIESNCPFYRQQVGSKLILV
jgi:hypothetical protein